MSYHEPDNMDARPKRQLKTPTHLSDYGLSGPGSLQRFQAQPHLDTREQEEDLSEEESVGQETGPISQHEEEENALPEDWKQLVEEIRNDNKDLRQRVSELQHSSIQQQQMKQENKDPHHQSCRIKRDQAGEC